MRLCGIGVDAVGILTDSIMNGKRIPRKKMTSGFTLVELIVSVGIFALMAVSLTAAFTSGFSTFGNSREIQRNVEAAQYSMNALAKYLRTSTILEATSSRIRFYDYSSKRCFEYRFDSGAMQARWAGIETVTDIETDCTASVLGAWQDVTSSGSSYVTGRFYAVSSSSGSPKSMGRATITISVKKSATSDLGSDIQTSVSLRDYDYVESAP